MSMGMKVGKNAAMAQCSRSFIAEELIG